MNRVGIFLIVLITACLSACASFPTQIGKNKSLAYGGLLFDNKKIEVTGIDARPIDQIIGIATPLKIVGKNEFIAESWKPGKYYIDVIHFNVPHGVFGIKQDEKMYVSRDSKLFFEIKENEINNIGSFHCEIVSKFGSADQFNVIEQGGEIDRIVLNDIIKLAEKSEWHEKLLQYYNKKFNKSSEAGI
jgi:hypothetical protein